MKAGIVVYPGTTCDRDTYIVFNEILGWDTEYIFYKDKTTKGADLIILPGGFSYGDYLRVGAIAKFSPITDAIYAHADKGLPILGICNGFQILLEMGLLRGALMQNKTGRFVCKEVTIRVEHTDSILTHAVAKGTVLRIPIAHMDGNYYIDSEGFKELKQKDLILFKYCDEKGETTESANPNGALENIAGIRNEQGNIVGLMPHPERAAMPFHQTQDGLKLLNSITRFLGGS